MCKLFHVSIKEQAVYSTGTQFCYKIFLAASTVSINICLPLRTHLVTQCFAAAEMAYRRSLAFFLVLSLLANALCLPPNVTFRRRRDSKDSDVNLDSSAVNTITESKDTTSDSSPTPATDDDDDDFDEDNFKPTTTSSGGGSNIFSLINLATAFLPSLSGSNNVKKNNEFVTKLIRDVIKQYQTRTIQKRQDIKDNVIEIDYASKLKPPFFERQESEQADDENSETSESDSEEDNGGEESLEEPTSETENSKQDSASNASNANSDDDDDDDDNNSDYDEPPDGDGQGGGILGVLAGLSGDGESDLGSLLAAFGGIVANLSSDEGSNPGEIIASYLLTSLDTISGGGATNNGAFFGKFLSTLVKGTSAGGDPDDSEENGGMKMADSAGFFLSLLMGLYGEMSKHSSGGSWR
ncbi:unnamed protein product [Arctia plantaginis]|uniref:Uncharacterized protein n=1 Tax=Arctia plantaginis TaxID=874455 RepID=A0A8S0YNC7_ARCPL|nr:unnamed protein product [Arctia plantaginis]